MVEPRFTYVPAAATPPVHGFSGTSSPLALPSGPPLGFPFAPPRIPPKHLPEEQAGPAEGGLERPAPIPGLGFGATCEYAQADRDNLVQVSGRPETGHRKLYGLEPMIQVEKRVPSAASVEDLQQAVADFRRYPEFIPELAVAKVLDEGRDWAVVEHEPRALPGVRYTLKYEIPAEGGLRWSHVGGVFKTISGSWHFVANGENATLATFSCDLELPGLPRAVQAPMIDLAVTTLMRRFRQRAEERLLRLGPAPILRHLGRAISHDGLSLAYEQFSGPSGIPLVYCNGMLQDTCAWMAIVRELRATHPQLLWDYRGCGASDVPVDLSTLTLENHCRDLERVLDTAGIERAVFLGHSMGAQIILEFERKHPQRVAGLIPVCGTFRDPFSTLFDMPQLRWAWLGLAGGLERFCRLLDPSWRAFISTSIGREVVLRIGTNRALVRDPDAQGFVSNFSRWDGRSLAISAKELSRHSADDHLEHVAAPTLVIAGDKDALTPVGRSKEMAARIPGAELFVVLHGSHVAILEQPELIALRIEKFVNRRISPNWSSSPSSDRAAPGPEQSGRP